VSRTDASSAGVRTQPTPTLNRLTGTRDVIKTISETASFNDTVKRTSRIDAVMHYSTVGCPFAAFVNICILSQKILIKSAFASLALVAYIILLVVILGEQDTCSNEHGVCPMPL